jgi:mRNA interferase RelE/StbE
MKYIILYQDDVIKYDIPRLGNIEKKYVKASIEEKLMKHPEIFGKPLRKSLKGYRKLRVRDLRIIFRIEDNSVKIFAIQHRSIIYKNFQKK